MTDFLEKILEHKRSLLKKKQAYFESLKTKIKKEKFHRYRLFKRGISADGGINLIAEIKKASPSHGLICENFDVLNIARIYIENGAKALSILTEEKFFLGKPTYITKVSENFPTPILTKDFIIEEGQVYEAFACGASAILLIVAILNVSQLKKLIQLAHHLDLDCLVEVHNESELEKALKVKAEIIGINNRNLRTFKVEFRTSEKLIPQIPKNKIIVSESGIKTHREILRLKELGAHAVLIGETFLKVKDIGNKIQEVMRGNSS